MSSKYISLILISLLIGGCATRPTESALLKEIPQLNSGFSRVYVSAGEMNGVKLWSDYQVGPVYFNNKKIGSTVKNEYFAVDIVPGDYEATCVPHKPEKNYIEKRNIKLQAGEERYFSCDMGAKGIGGSFGLIGAILSEYLTVTYLQEKPSFDNKYKLVSYQKLQ